MGGNQNSGRYVLPKASPASKRAVEPPKWLGQLGAIEWRRLAAHAQAQGCLDDLSKGPFAAMCAAYESMIAAHKLLRKDPEDYKLLQQWMMASRVYGDWCDKLRLSPQKRPVVQQPEEISELDRFRGAS